MLGPPGIGKSTLLEELVARRLGAEWLTREEAVSGFSPPLQHPYVRWAEEFASQRNPASSGYTEGFCRKFVDLARDVAVIEAVEGPPVVLDESPTLRALSFALRPEHGFRFARRYVRRVLPPPLLVLHLSADPEVVVCRLLGRTKGPIPLYTGLSREGLREVSSRAVLLSNRLATQARRMGVRVAQVDVSGPLDAACVGLSDALRLR